MAALEMVADGAIQNTGREYRSMSNGRVWSEEEKQTVIRMRQEKYSYQEIARELGRSKESLNSFINRCNADGDIVPRRRNSTSCLVEYQKRRKCHALGMTDREAAEEWHVSYGTYSCWRIKAKLPCNPERQVLDKVLVEKEVKPVKKLEPADIEHYKHNNHTQPINNYNSPVTIIVDKDLVKKELDRLGIKPKAKLSESPKYVIGSKWTDPDSSISAKKNCRDRMRNHG